MADPRGFLHFDRQEAGYRKPEERLKDWKQVQKEAPNELVRDQASRCMDCGIPFCMQGCPLGNIIPDWNDLVYRDAWEEALQRLHSTNNFPEFTGLVCPAPCEQACVLGVNQDPVSIKLVEWKIIQRAFEEGRIQPQKPSRQSGRTIAIVGSGPAGLAAAQQLVRAGHAVDVYEKADRIGGLLRYGIPDFKLEKWVIDRRLDQIREEGVRFHTGVHIGKDLSISELRDQHDAVLLCLGAEKARDLDVPGRELAGVHSAQDFLAQQNQRVAGDHIADHDEIVATDRHVVILGGGDTGSDCTGTALRQGARSVTSFELLPQPPIGRHPSEPWPRPKIFSFQVSSSHEEGGERYFARLTKGFTGESGRVNAIHAVRVEFDVDELERPLMDSMRELPGTEFELPADLVLLAMGFLRPETADFGDDAIPKLNARGCLEADTQHFATSQPGVFAAGDCRRGQSLVVWALWEGREAARAIDAYLMGSTQLQAKNSFF